MKKLIAASLCIALALSLCACISSRSAAGDYSAVYAAVKKCQSENQLTVRNVAFDDNNAEAAMDTDEDHSKTNVQTEGIDEGDLVKTDGSYVYYLNGKSVTIYEAAGEDSRRAGSVELGEDIYACSMYVEDGVLALITGSGGVWDSFDRPCTTVYYYDVSDPASARLIASAGQDGWLTTSRLYDRRLYLVTSYYVEDEAVRTRPETYVPQLYLNGASRLADGSCISIMPEPGSTCYTVAAAYDMKSGALAAHRAVLGADGTVYMNKTSLYLSASRVEQETLRTYKESVYDVSECSAKQYTDIMRLNASDLSPSASGTVNGYLDSQFSMDEYNGALRVVTTAAPSYWSIYTDAERELESCKYDTERSVTSNNLYILDGALNMLSSVEGLAENERVYSVRFDADFVYFCTFRQTDPLFAADVSDPKAPRILSELKISGFSEYLHKWSEDRLFGLGNEADEDSGMSTGLKLVMFDTSDKADVTVKNTLNLAEGSYTSALYDHTALLISPGRNIIGFGTDEEYLLFSYSDENGFEKRAGIAFDGAGAYMRAVYVGKYAYIVSDSGMRVLDMDSCELTATV